jgi:hypothetical protein
LAKLVSDLPIGTNSALYQFLWMLLSGRLHDSRGAIFPALQSMGLTEAEVRRSWAGFRYGRWTITSLLSVWSEHVDEQQQWQAHSYAGYRVKAVDITAFWRSTLEGLKSKHYNAEAGKALPAIPLGLIGRVGSVGEQRFAMLTDIVRADLQDPGEKRFIAKLLEQVAKGLNEDEMAVFDAGFHPQQLFDAKIQRFVVRLAKNFTARHNYVIPNPLGRPSEYGELVRPLARSYEDKAITSTPPDRVETWFSQGLEYRAEYWDALVLPECKANSANSIFYVVAIYDPHFEEPWLLACPIKLSGKVLSHFYYDRWPVEQLPLAAKHMVGADRQFVFAPESCHRLPELSLLAGSILTYLAATLPPVPTGFWDHNPKRTPGRLRRVLAQVHFPNLPNPLPGQIRKKASVFGHLPKGTQAHRRQKQVAAASPG